ncbi:MAG: Porphobilinogen deaminase [Proteobacteria bacterium]|nr:Porphobilinogen deaminase [Pseudomonadota bacterium]
MPPPTKITIATRQSRLALWQAEHVRHRLQAIYPEAEIALLGLTTTGDQILDRPLAEIGGKGLFIKELEVAMQEGRADLAVHSLKDVPMQMPQGFALAAVLQRENPSDAFVSNRYTKLDDLPPGAVVGTSSLRREAILRVNYPQLAVRSLRGNLDTRLGKLDAGDFDAVILAAAGLIRLGIKNRIASLLDSKEWLPAPGQGALGIEICSGRADLQEWLTPLHDQETGLCVQAERAFSRALGGSCQLPLGAYAEFADSRLRLRGFIGGLSGQPMRSGEVSGAAADAEALGLELADRLRG